LRIALDTPETARSSIHGALRAMARPGLEPGTPRFSGAGRKATVRAGIPATRRVCLRQRLDEDVRNLRSYPLDLGTEIGPST
jgi:hypothetical protein